MTDPNDNIPLTNHYECGCDYCLNIAEREREDREDDRRETGELKESIRRERNGE